MTKGIRTPYGTVRGDRIYATCAQLYAWATRPGAAWPCATLVRAGGGWAEYERSGTLVDLSPGWYRADLDAWELHAWAEDVRALAAPGE